MLGRECYSTGNDENSTIRPNLDMKFRLLDMMETDDIDRVQELLQTGLQVNEKDEHGNTALMLASEKGFAGMTGFLLSHGADVNAKNSMGDTALYLALENGHTRVVSALLRAGADVRGKVRDGATPLHLACGGDSDGATINLLLDAGATMDVGALDGWDNTPLHSAAWAGAHGTVRLLLSHGAGLNARNKHMSTPLQMSCASGSLGVVRLLVEAGADVHVRNRDGNSALDLARKLPRDDPAREEVLDLFREFHPDLVMEAWCQSNTP